MENSKQDGQNNEKFSKLDTFIIDLRSFVGSDSEKMEDFTGFSTHSLSPSLRQ